MLNTYPGTSQYPQSSSDFEILSERLTLEWLFNRKAMCFTVGTSHPDVITKWVERRRQIALAWPVGQPLFEMIDLTSKDCTVTPYMWKAVKTLHRILQIVPTCAAIAMRQENWLIDQMVQTYVQVCKLDGINMRIEVVHTREQGLAWLEQQIEAYHSAPV